MYRFVGFGYFILLFFERNVAPMGLAEIWHVEIDRNDPESQLHNLFHNIKCTNTMNIGAGTAQTTESRLTTVIFVCIPSIK